MSDNVGDILRYWRGLRRFSQMDLALEAEVSTRHLSFVETGRSKPSRDLLVRLADVLQMPPKQTNLLFVSAGYAPRYTDLALDDERMAEVRLALEHMLTQHSPYPALVINRAYDMLMQNAGLERLFAWMAEGNEALHQHTNMYRLMFAPEGMRRYCPDWHRLYPMLLKRLRDEAVAYQSAELMQLYDDCAADVTVESQSPEFDHQFPVMTFSLCKDGVELEFFSAMTTFGTAIDVTVQELRLESFFPANDATRRFFDGLVQP